MNRKLIGCTAVELQPEIGVESGVRGGAGADTAEGMLIRHNGGDQHLGDAWRAGVERVVPDEGRLVVDLGDLVGALALKRGDLQRLNIHGRAGHCLDRLGKGQGDWTSGRPFVGDGDNPGTLAAVQLR